MATIPGGAIVVGFDAGAFGQNYDVAPDLIEVFGTRGVLDDPTFLFTLAPVVEPGRWLASGKIPDGYAPGEEVNVFGRLTYGHLKIVRRLDRFTVDDPGLATAIKLLNDPAFVASLRIIAAVAAALAPQAAKPAAGA